MIEGKTILAVIPARGSSKGVSRKNIRNVAGKPLIAWTIEEANKSRYLDRLVLSSEDNEIIQVANQWGCEVPFVRPFEMAQDETPGVEPVLHALSELPGYDYVVMLQPTSPLRSVQDIDGCIEKCIRTNSNSCVTVSLTEKSPYWMYLLDADNRMRPFVENNALVLRRQDLPKVYALNGAVYVAEKTWLKQERSFIAKDTLGYEMPRERSFDIDTELDIRVCETLLGMKEI